MQAKRALSLQDSCGMERAEAKESWNTSRVSPTPLTAARCGVFYLCEILQQPSALQLPCRGADVMRCLACSMAPNFTTTAKHPPRPPQPASA